VRAKTNTPIIGVLTQPIPSSSKGDHIMWETQFNSAREAELKAMLEQDPLFDMEDIFPRGQFVENTHIKFLESAGARVVPVDW